MSWNKYKVLFVDDEAEDRKLLLMAFSEHYVFTLAQDVDAMNHYLDAEDRFDLMLLDLELVKGSNDLIGLRLIQEILKKRPGLPIVVVTKDKRNETSKTALDNGAVDFVLKSGFDEKKWKASFEKAIKNAQLARVQDKMQRLANMGKTKHFIGESPKMLEIKRILKAVSQTPNTPVLILGETGTGKEVAAHYLHNQSPRKNKALVAVNLSAIQETLLESTLFGSVKGAFTGAIRDTEGYFRQANGGILMLDEIGDINMDIQIKLLRFLEDRKIRPVGSDSDVQLDVQIIAATHQDLAESVKNGTFREDLYQRLKAMTIELPPLRARKDDIPLLLQHYFGDPFRVEENFAPAAWEQLFRFDWPGNVRDLRNAIDYMLLRQLILEKHLIDEECLPDDVLHLKHAKPGNDHYPGATEERFSPTSTPRTFFNPVLPRLEALTLLNLHYIESAMITKNKVKQDVANMLGFKSADSLLYDIKTIKKDFPHLFEGDAFPNLKQAYPLVFR